jgi:hypothetical protein
MSLLGPSLASLSRWRARSGLSRPARERTLHLGPDGNPLPSELLKDGAYQPHHEVITRQDQVQIYEELSKNAKGWSRRRVAIEDLETRSSVGSSRSRTQTAVRVGRCLCPERVRNMSGGAVRLAARRYIQVRDRFDRASSIRGLP